MPTLSLRGCGPAALAGWAVASSAGELVDGGPGDGGEEVDEVAVGISRTAIPQRVTSRYGLTVSRQFLVADDHQPATSQAQSAAGEPKRIRFPSGSIWEPSRSLQGVGLTGRLIGHGPTQPEPPQNVKHRPPIEAAAVS